MGRSMLRPYKDTRSPSKTGRRVGGKVLVVDGGLTRFPFGAEAANRFAQTNGESGDGFQALRSALRQTAVAFPPNFGEQKLRVSENARKRVVQFVAKHLAEIFAVQIHDSFLSGRLERFFVR